MIETWNGRSLGVDDALTGGIASWDDGHCGAPAKSGAAPPSHDNSVVAAPRLCQAFAVRWFDAVLFDWSGTLVHDPPPPAADPAAPSPRSTVRTTTRWSTNCGPRCTRRANLPDVAAELTDEDTSAERHRFSNMLWFDRAGIEEQLAAALYDFDHEIDNRPLYPDAAPKRSSH